MFYCWIGSWLICFFRVFSLLSGLIHQDFFPKISCVLKGTRTNVILEVKIKIISITYKKKKKHSVDFTKSLKSIGRETNTSKTKLQPGQDMNLLPTNHLYKQHLVSLKTSVKSLITFVDTEAVYCVGSCNDVFSQLAF